MKITFKFAAIATMAVSALALTACGDNNPGGGQSVEATATFGSINDAIYHGDAKNNGLGFYTMKFKTDKHILSLELSSALTDAEAPMPEAGTYAFSAENKLNTFNDNSSWWSENNGTEVTRRFDSGSFSWQASEKGYKIKGWVIGRDNVKLNFEYDGAVKFDNQGRKPDDNAIVCQSAYGTYYGRYYIPSAADYYVVLYDTQHLKPGDPYNYRICLDFTSIAPAGSIMPALGTYSADTEGIFAERTFVPSVGDGEHGTLWQVPDGSGVIGYPVSEGSFTIRKTNDGKYQIFGTLKNQYEREISFNYVGSLSFNNEASGPRTSLTGNFDMGTAFYANQKCVSKSEEGNLWNLYFYDEASWSSKGKDGYFISFNMALPADVTAIPAGTYTATEHVLLPKPGQFISGYMFATLGAHGSWLAKGNGSVMQTHAPVRGGTLNLVKNADNTYTATFDVLDDNYTPNYIKGSFTGEVPLAQGSLAPAFVMQQPIRGSVAGHDPHSRR